MKIFKRVIQILVIILVTLALLEAVLIITDPLGIAYFQEVLFLDPYYYGIPDAAYGLSPGTYHMHGWTATVQADGTRLVPAAGERCKVLFVGDSLTFGWGSDDAATFVNLLAEPLDIQAVNAGMIGYNSQNVDETIQANPDYDFAVYLMFTNDHEVRWQNDRPMRPPGEYVFKGPGIFQSGNPLTLMYLLYFTRAIGSFVPETSIDNFRAAMAALATHDNLTIFAFDSPLTAEAQQIADITVIPWYTQRVSYIDFHPNAAGNQEIAAAMLPVLEPQVAQCA